MRHELRHGKGHVTQGVPTWTTVRTATLQDKNFLAPVETLLRNKSYTNLHHAA